MKICIICKFEQNDDRFSKDSSRKDGLNPRCKTCKSQIDAEYRKSHKEQIQSKRITKNTLKY